MLTFNWITENHIDFEYKKYLLLAYLQKVAERFGEVKLFPHYSELKKHQENLLYLRQKKKEMARSFPKNLKAIDLEQAQMIYEKAITDSDLMAELETILDYSIPKFDHYIKEGCGIYELVRENMNIYPVGLLPLYKKEGYIILRSLPKKQALVYQYSLKIVNDGEHEFQTINTQYLTNYTISISNTLEAIKINLIKYNRELPNPATYAVESEVEFPLYETFLPVAKKAVANYIYISESQ
ncbi:MAG: hypothetical protein COA57_01410 [Flavobacteriales bacterium]|nr:hypothetical protein [Bacteroidales bacterium AH-315-I05]PCJ89698.1 MAG: hypothetical protein COA57_01410 [Flavobacteriales bacterium]